MNRIVPRLLSFVVVLIVGGSFSSVAFASTIPIGLFSFDVGTSAGTTFDITNLTGTNAFPPDFPITSLLTIAVTSLTANTTGGQLIIDGSRFSSVDPQGDVGCTVVGDAGSGGCNFAAYDIMSAILTGTVTPLTGLAGLPTGYTGIANTFTATITPNCGSMFLTAGCDAATINATLVAAEQANVPEPSTGILLCIGLLALAGYKLKRNFRLAWNPGAPRSWLARWILGVLVAAVVVLAPSRGWAQSLTASANPPSGAAGVNNTYLTGSGFPAGAITGATVHLAATCLLPELASSPVIQAVAVGTLRRFQFLIPASLAPGTYKVWVSGTAGTVPFNTLNTPSCSSITVTSSVQGTASLGAAISGAAVTLMDANGKSVSGTTASDGTFALNTAGLVPPFLLKVVTSQPTPNFPAGTTLYSVSADANASTRINVNVLTDLMVRSFYSAQGINISNAFTNPAGTNAPPDPTAVEALANLVLPAVQLWLDQAGITATSGPPSNGSINLISSPMVAYPPGVPPAAGLDKVLDLIQSETVNAADGSVSRVTIVGGTITETLAAVYSNGLITLNTTTIDSATGSGSSATVSGLALTGALAQVINGVNAGLSIFRDTINAKGTQLTGTDLLPFFAPDYLNDGNNAAQEANATAAELAGATILSARVVGIKSFDPTTNVADVLVFFLFSGNGQTVGGTDEVFFRNEGGMWLAYGNQRIASVRVLAESRTFQGQQPPGTPFNQTDIFAGVEAPHGVVTGAVVTGPTNNSGARIWNGNSSGTLIQGAQLLEGGQSFDQFFLLSQSLGNDLSTVNAQVPAGSTFAFTLTTASGNPQYTVQSNAFTTEVIQLTKVAGLPVAPVSLSLLVGQTRGFEFTLPRTYPIAGVSLSAQIYNGLPNQPTTRGCNVPAAGPLMLDFTSYSGSGLISFPANMSACGLNPSVPIRFINVFVEVDGVHSEDNIVQFSVGP
jgi:hypothetical protein